jgi:hypothetical protein
MEHCLESTASHITVTVCSVNKAEIASEEGTWKKFGTFSDIEEQ